MDVRVVRNCVDLFLDLFLLGKSALSVDIKRMLNPHKSTPAYSSGSSRTIKTCDDVTVDDDKFETPPAPVMILPPTTAADVQFAKKIGMILLLIRVPALFW
jgi:hypothetical protein